MSSNLFTNLQKVGQAFMLPVAMLPIAGLLLGIGSAHFYFIPEIISQIMAQSGGSIFTVLPVIFAISTAIAFAGMDGVAALAALAAYYVYLASLGVLSSHIGVETKNILGINSVDTGVIGGILIGFVTAYCHNRFKNIQLPEFLGFFGGRRFVPIISSIFALFIGLAMAFIWKPVGGAIEVASDWAAYENPMLSFTVYAFVERLLLPFGLHHIWNAPYFFEVGTYTTGTGEVVKGEVARFLHGDPTAGHFGGGYIFKMFGLPAAAMAIAFNAKPEKRKVVFSLMLSAAFTSFLTGITEPIEFSFLFVAPILYLIHALLVTSAYAVAMLLDIRHAMTFSQGFIDYVLLYSNSSRAWLLIPVGLVYSGIYFAVFMVAIRFFNLKTPGREVDQGVVAQPQELEEFDKSDLAVANKLIEAYGGADNITHTDSCITRLRISVKDKTKINKDLIKQLGAKGYVQVGNVGQSIFGSDSEKYRELMDKELPKLKN